MNKRKNNGLMAIILLVAVVAVSGVLYGTYAKYLSSTSGSATLEAAKWSIAVKDNLGNELTNNIAVALDTNANVVDGKIAPGRSGSFEIEIDPNGTEVSFDYAITLGNVATKPTGLTITKYQVHGGADQTIGENGITGSLALANTTTPFAATDAKTITVFVEWVGDVTENDTNDTTFGSGATDEDRTITVPVTVTLTQKLA